MELCEAENEMLPVTLDIDAEELKSSHPLPASDPRVELATPRKVAAFPPMVPAVMVTSVVLDVQSTFSVRCVVVNALVV